MSPTSLQRSSHLLFAAAQKLGLEPEWLTDWGLIKVKIKDIETYLFTSKTILNNQLSAYLSTNKNATRVLFEQHNLPNIPFSSPKDLLELEAFFSQHQPIVTKPTMGQRAQDVRIIKTADQLPDLKLIGHIFEKYIAGPEYRYLVLEGKVITAQQKIFEGEIYNSATARWISFPEGEWDSVLVEHALAATKLLGLGFSAVDFKIDAENRPYILEVNSAPAISRSEQPDEGPSVPVSEFLLKATIRKIEATSSA